MINIDWEELDKKIVAEHELMLDREIVNLILQGSKMKTSYKDLQVILEALECKVAYEENRHFPHERQSKLIDKVKKEIEKIENEER